jgi:hypothetical protein
VHNMLSIRTKIVRLGIHAGRSTLPRELWEESPTRAAALGWLFSEFPRWLPYSHVAKFRRDSNKQNVTKSQWAQQILEYWFWHAFVRLGFERLTDESNSQLRPWPPKMFPGREWNYTPRKALHTPQKTTLLALQQKTPQLFPLFCGQSNFYNKMARVSIYTLCGDI